MSYWTHMVACMNLGQARQMHATVIKGCLVAYTRSSSKASRNPKAPTARPWETELLILSISPWPSWADATTIGHLPPLSPYPWLPQWQASPKFFQQSQRQNWDHQFVIAGKTPCSLCFSCMATSSPAARHIGVAQAHYRIKLQPDPGKPGSGWSSHEDSLARQDLAHGAW